jgi:hypothetical protein
MQAKDIKRLVIKQLKQRFPHWRRLTKKQKKALADQVLRETASDSSSEDGDRMTAQRKGVNLALVNPLNFLVELARIELATS